MLSALSVFYLFLGGSGAGALAVCSLIDLFCVRRPFGNLHYDQAFSDRPFSRVVDYGFLIGFVCLVVGILSLIFDLGRTDRLIDLFLNPSASFLSIGSYVLMIVALLAGFTTLVRFLYLPEISRRIVVAVEWGVVFFALATMLYVGFLLQSVGGVGLWASPFIPVLFFLSSSSGGIAIVLLVTPFFFVAGTDRDALRTLMLIDAVLIVIELLCVVMFLLSIGHSAHPAAAESFALLTQGSYALVWWLGFVGLGLVGPLLLEVLYAFWFRDTHIMLAFAAVLVLIGAFCLRWGIVEAGVHRQLVLESVLHDGSVGGDILLGEERGGLIFPGTSETSYTIELAPTLRKQL